MPENWPVLTGERCVLRVLDEDDLPHWRTDEGNRLLGPWQEFYSDEPAPEVVATRWALNNLEPDTVVVLLPEDETADLGALAAAGFRPDGPAEPWEVGRTRHRFDPQQPG